MGANDKQVGGSHYQSAVQHWDIIAKYGVGYLEGNATKYLTRWRKKNGLQDLEKALHYVDKAHELALAGDLVNGSSFASTDLIDDEAWADLEAFFDQNPIGPGEEGAFRWLVTWVQPHDLTMARMLIESVIAEEQNRVNANEVA